MIANITTKDRQRIGKAVAIQAGDRNAGNETSNAARAEGASAATTINDRLRKEAHRDFPDAGSAMRPVELKAEVSARKSSEMFISLSVIGEDENPLVCKEMTSTSLTRTTLPLQDVIVVSVPSEVR